MNKRNSITRREFLEKTGKGATTAVAMAATAPGVLGAKSPNETVGIGCIGLGVRGGTLCRHFSRAEGAKVVAVCDVYKPHREKGLHISQNPDAKAYVDYHDLLADPNVDAVTIAVPDHWHSIMLIDAAKAGKAAYVEKGWTRTIAEAKKMLAAVKKSGIVMQLGHQARALPAGIQAAELIKDGVIGPVTLVRTGRFENRPLGQNIWRWYGGYTVYDRPDPKEVIRDLDWDRWLGPLEKRPFKMEHFWHWRCYWDYGTGVAGDLLSHELDFVQSVLDHGIPNTCMCTGYNALLKDGREVPDTWNTVYHWEKEGRTVTFDCSMNTAALVQPPEFRGKEATLRFDTIAQSVSTFDVFAERYSKKYTPLIESGKIPYGEPFKKFDASKTPEPPNHQQEFVNCVKSGTKTKCNEDEAFIETATFLMSVESLKKKRLVRWDREKEEIV